MTQKFDGPLLATPGNVIAKRVFSDIDPRMTQKLHAMMTGDALALSIVGKRGAHIAAFWISHDDARALIDLIQSTLEKTGS